MDKNKEYLKQGNIVLEAMQNVAKEIDKLRELGKQIDIEKFTDEQQDEMNRIDEELYKIEINYFR